MTLSRRTCQVKATSKRTYRHVYDNVLQEFQYFDFRRYNDIPLVYNEKMYNKLRSAGIDHQLAQHIAHLFVRDTVSLFSEKVHQDDTVEMDHFEVYFHSF